MPEIPRRINDFIDRNVRGVRSLTTEILNALYNCPGIDNYVGIQIISQYTDTNIIYINQYTQGDEDTKLIKRLARNRYLKFPSKQHFIYHLVKHYKKFNPMDLIDDLIDDFDRIAGLYHAILCRSQIGNETNADLY
uniref:Uncharacterized protein n=1 Tax=Acrobeloides nanus TaxID=290746 RepID=A0A914DE04_9BILA